MDCESLDGSYRHAVGANDVQSTPAKAQFRVVKLLQSYCRGLDRTDITIDGVRVWIESRHRIHIGPNDATEFEVATIWHRWHSILGFSERYPSRYLPWQNTCNATCLPI